MLTRRAFLAALFGAAGGLAAWNLRRPQPVTVPAAAVERTPVEPTTTTAAPTTSTGPSVTRLEVVGREGWGAAEAGTLGTHMIDRVTFHHTGSVLIDNRRAPFRMRDLQAFHQQQGWPDVAYHFLIDRNGHVYEGRPVTAPGDTFTDYDPTGHFLPVLDGNFDEQEPTEAQLSSLAVLVAWALDEFGLDDGVLGAHRDYAATACPGEAAYVRRGELLGRIRSVRAAGHIEMIRLVGDEADHLVADIEAGVV